MAEQQSNKQETEDVVIENEDGTVTLNPGRQDSSDHESDGEGHTDDNDDDDDGEGGSDERLTSSGESTGAEDGHEETIQERRRRERREKKLRAKEREESLIRENKMLAQQIRETNERLNLIERKGQGTELAQLDHAIAEAGKAEAYFKQMVSDGVTAGNGEVVADAQEKMYAAKIRKEQMMAARQAAARQTTQTAKPALQPPRELVQHANAWMTKNAWYDPQNGDDDSAVLAALDKRLGQEGRFDPATPQYWEELDKRAAKVLPHRYRNTTVGSTVRKPARTPATGSGRDAPSTGGGSSEFKVSAQRVQALKDAGFWNDPKLRAAAIKDFQAFDRKEAAKSRSNGGSN
jgi:hypothetical protein